MKIVIMSNDFYKLYEELDTYDIFGGLNQLGFNFSDKRITDYHFEPTKDNVKVKIRYSGELLKFKDIKKETYEELVNLILLQTGKDIINDTKNTDGSFEYNGLNFRVSFMKSVNGVSLVIRRLQNINEVFVNIPEDLESKILRSIQSKAKVTIFSGPTGAGKSTTMAYIINKIKNDYKVHSIENPVEYINENIIQINIDQEDQSDILKYILRQDPEIIQIGEVREEYFAKLLFDSATTGHSLVASLHSQNVIKALKRLNSLGISEEQIKTNCDLIINQRLIPKICNECSGKGCKKCFYTGQDGYLTVFEYLQINEKIFDLIKSSGDLLVSSNMYFSYEDQLSELYNNKNITYESYIKTKDSFKG
ncbi:MAG: ATPase, T2SS/T4P/T4SS family [Thermotogota bacterium]